MGGAIRSGIHGGIIPSVLDFTKAETRPPIIPAKGLHRNYDWMVACEQTD